MCVLTYLYICACLLWCVNKLYFVTPKQSLSLFRLCPKYIKQTVFLPIWKKKYNNRFSLLNSSSTTNFIKPVSTSFTHSKSYFHLLLHHIWIFFLIVNKNTQWTVSIITLCIFIYLVVKCNWTCWLIAFIIHFSLFYSRWYFESYGSRRQQQYFYTNYLRRRTTITLSTTVALS